MLAPASCLRTQDCCLKPLGHLSVFFCSSRLVALALKAAALNHSALSPSINRHPGAGRGPVTLPWKPERPGSRTSTERPDAEFSLVGRIAQDLSFYPRRRWSKASDEDCTNAGGRARRSSGRRFIRSLGSKSRAYPHPPSAPSPEGRRNRTSELKRFFRFTCDESAQACDPAHIGQQDLGYIDRTVGVLVVLHHGDQGATDGRA